MNQIHSDRIGLLFEAVFIVEPHHPDLQVVCQNAALKKSGIGPEILGKDTSRCHLVFAPFNPVLTGGTFPVIFMACPGSQIHVGHIAEIFVLNLRLREQRIIGFRGDDFTHCHETPGSFPVAALVFEFRAFERTVFDFSPFLGSKEISQAFQFDLDRVPGALFFEEIEQVAIEKGTVGPNVNAPDPLWKTGKTLFDKFDAAVCGVGIAGSKPIVEAFTGFGNKAQKGMVGFLVFFVRIVSFGGPFLRTEYRPHSGIKFESDFSEIFFGPYFSANFVLNFSQFFTVPKGKQFEDTAEGGSIRELVPFKQFPERVVRSKDSQVTDVLCAGEHTHNQHQNRIRDLIGSGIASFDADVLVKELVQVQFLGESAQEGKPGIAGEIFLIECSVKYPHHMSASLVLSFGGFCIINT